MNLKGKTAIITGGSGGIGRQIALKLARAGVKLALIARNEAKLTQTAQEIRNRGVKVQTYACDITQIGFLKESVKKIISDFKEIQILINNAGIWHKRDPLELIEEQTVDQVIQTNLTALIQVTRLTLPILKKQEEAAIINISSRSGLRAAEGQSVYSASKWGVRGFTEVLKADLKGSGVRVAGVYPAGTKTEIFSKAGEAMPTENYTKPEDLAEVVLFMLSRPSKIWLHDVRVEY